jgi:chromosomal replication initiator protein
VTKDDKDVVSTLCATLADKVGKERFELWFGSGTWFRWAERALTIGVPNRFFRDWIRANFRRQIESACLETLGKCPAIKFHVDAADSDDAAASAPPAKAGEADGPAAATSPEATPPAGMNGANVAAGKPGDGQPSRRQASPGEIAPAGTRRKFASLGSFVTGQSNRLAFVSAEMVARRPGQITPLLIHGPTSVGKTHLLEGIWTAAQRTHRGATPIYLSAEQFTSFFLEALRGSGLPSFRRKYRGVGLLLLDDLQFLIGKRATQVELLHTIDTLLREGRQLVFSADRPPSELAELGPELTTRLASGMVCRIEPPDYPTRLGIVGQMAKRLGVNVPADVERLIASRLTSHAREISGAICRLQATSEALGRPISLALAEEALGEMIRRNSRVVRLGDIQKAVCQVFGLEPASLQSDGKAKRLSHPRMLAMWLARKHTRAALSEIGNFFGRRSHSTVISAQKRVDGWMAAGLPLHLCERTWQIDDAIREVERQLLAG